VIKRRIQFALQPAIRLEEKDRVIVDRDSDLIAVILRPGENKPETTILGYTCKSMDLCNTYKIRYNSSLYISFHLEIHIFLKKYILGRYDPKNFRRPDEKTNSFSLFDITSGHVLSRAFLHVTDPCAHSHMYMKYFFLDGVLILVSCDNSQRIRLYKTRTTCLFANESNYCKLPMPSVLDPVHIAVPFLTVNRDLIILPILQKLFGILLYRYKEAFKSYVQNNIEDLYTSICRTYFGYKMQTLVKVCKQKVSVTAYKFLCLPQRGIVSNANKCFYTKLPVDLRYSIMELDWNNIQICCGDGTVLHLSHWYQDNKWKVLRSVTAYSYGTRH
jgi:hypothetical protein